MSIWILFSLICRYSSTVQHHWCCAFRVEWSTRSSLRHLRQKRNPPSIRGADLTRSHIETVPEIPSRPHVKESAWIFTELKLYFHIPHNTDAKTLEVPTSLRQYSKNYRIGSKSQSNYIGNISYHEIQFSIQLSEFNAEYPKKGRRK